MDANVEYRRHTQAGGTKPIMLAGWSGEGVVAQLHGKYYQQTLAGKLFHGEIASAAVAITSATAVTGALLWNPAGSGVNAVIARVALGWVGTTEGPGNTQLAFITQAGSSVATAAPITAFTEAAPHCGLLGNSPANQVRFGTAATVTAPTKFIGLGMSALTTTGTATFGSHTKVYDAEGLIIIPPNVAVWLCASAASGTTYTQTMSWYEMPTVPL